MLNILIWVPFKFAEYFPLYKKELTEGLFEGNKRDFISKDRDVFLNGKASLLEGHFEVETPAPEVESITLLAITSYDSE